jgi:hypothetical protein
MTTTQGVGNAMSGDRTTTDSRAARLAAQVRALRTRAGSGRLDRWMLVIGGALMPLGALLIVLGWVGASRTPLPFEQNDYLISGGLLGLGLLIAGGFVYFGYWQTLRIRESREQARELTAALGRLETLLTHSGVVPEQRDNGTGPGRFVATANGSIFHRPDCPVVSERSDLRAVDAEHTTLQPCRICSPLAAAK